MAFFLSWLILPTAPLLTRGVGKRESQGNTSRDEEASTGALLARDGAPLDEAAARPLPASALSGFS